MAALRLSILAACVLACLVSSPAVATDYYIDFTSGDDSNSGGADTLAWKTLDNVSTALSAGNTIKFKRGETWRLKDLDGATPAHFWKMQSVSGSSGSPITITSYGDSGAPLPIITTLELWAGTWRGLASPANVWSTDGSHADPGRCFFDGVGQGRADSVNDLDADETWYIADGDTTLCVYSTSNPANMTVETLPGDGSTSPVAIALIHVDYMTVTDLAIHGGQTGALLLSGDCDEIEVSDCEVKYMLTAGIHSHSNWAGTRSNILIKDNVVDYMLESDEVIVDGQNSFPDPGGADGISFWDDADDVTIRDNYIKNFSHTGIQLACHDDSADGITDCTVESNEVTAPDVAHGRGWAITGVDSMATGNVVRWNYVHDTRSGNHCNGESNDYYANVIVDVSDDLLNASASTGLNVNAWNEPTFATVANSNRIFNNTVVLTDYAGLAVSHTCDWDTTDVCGATNYVFDNLFANNIFVDCGSEEDYYYQIRVQDSDGIYDNDFSDNCLFVSGEDTLISYKETDYTVTAANSASLDDDFTDNIASDPDFDDYANYDFHVPNTSPCFEAGFYIGSFYDYDGEAYHNTPTMGAFEWYKSRAGDGEADEEIASSRFECFPNPSGSSMSFQFTIGEPAEVHLAIYNVAGRLITTVAEGNHTPGEYLLEWDGIDSAGRKLPSGVYFARFKASDRPASSAKVVLLR